MSLKPKSWSRGERHAKSIAQQFCQSRQFPDGCPAAPRPNGVTIRSRRPVPRAIDPGTESKRFSTFNEPGALDGSEHTRQEDTSECIRPLQRSSAASGGMLGQPFYGWSPCSPPNAIPLTPFQRGFSPALGSSPSRVAKHAIRSSRVLLAACRPVSHLKWQGRTSRPWHPARLPISEAQSDSGPRLRKTSGTSVKVAR